MFGHLGKMFRPFSILFPSYYILFIPRNSHFVKRFWEIQNRHTGKRMLPGAHLSEYPFAKEQPEVRSVIIYEQYESVDTAFTKYGCELKCGWDILYHTDLRSSTHYISTIATLLINITSLQVPLWPTHLHQVISKMERTDQASSGCGSEKELGKSYRTGWLRLLQKVEEYRRKKLEKLQSYSHPIGFYLLVDFVCPILRRMAAPLEKGWKIQFHGMEMYSVVWKYSGNKTFVLWKRYRFSTHTTLPLCEFLYSSFFVLSPSAVSFIGAHLQIYSLYLPINRFWRFVVAKAPILRLVLSFFATGDLVTK